MTSGGPGLEAIGPGLEATGQGLESTTELLKFEVAELSSEKRQQLKRDPQILGFARSLPVKLIEPMADTADAIAPVTKEVSAWGLSAVRAVESPYDGAGVVVAVLDTGIDASHPAFTGVAIEQRNFTNESNQDLNGHGTHCAGTIFGRDVDGVRIGAARNIKRALIGKVLGAGGGSSADIAQAILWAADNGAHVVSMSLGIDYPGFVARKIAEGYDVAQATGLALEAYRENVEMFGTLAKYLKARAPMTQGCIIVSASGNESRRPEVEIGAAPPAAARDIICVGALQRTPSLSVAGFSNRNVDLAAPGVGILSAWPGGGLRRLSGTSMATPHVAGVAALWAQKLLQSGSVLNPAFLTARLIGTATAGALAPGSDEDDVGTGIVQAPLS